MQGSEEMVQRCCIILASASPRRSALLRLFGAHFQVTSADIDERGRPGEGPEALTERLARSKASAVAGGGAGCQASHGEIQTARTEEATHSRNASVARHAPPVRAGSPIVLAADTVVVLDGTILGKPHHSAEATAILVALRGRAHRVLTGLALAVDQEVAWSSVTETTVWMRHYDDGEIERYVRSGKPLDKAGAYGIQDTDFGPVARIDGCHANVVGLPLCEVRRALAAICPGGGSEHGRVVPGMPARDAAPTAPNDPCWLCERAREL